MDIIQRLHETVIAQDTSCDAALLDDLARAIEEAKHLLPSQGPITSFVHHNTLHALEELPFDEALRESWKILRCEPYLSEERFLQMLQRGEIAIEDLSAVLLEDLGEDADHLIGVFGTRYHLRLAMLQYRIGTAPASELRWMAAESQALRRYRDDLPPGVRERQLQEIRRWVLRDVGTTERGRAGTEKKEPDDSAHRIIADLCNRFGVSRIEHWSEAVWEEFSLTLLWRLCRQGVHGLPAYRDTFRALVRPCDLLLEATGEDVDSLVNDVLIRFCSAYLDQGFATWKLPHQEQGFLAAFTALYSGSSMLTPWWMREVPEKLQRLQQSGISPLASIAESLHEMGIREGEQEAFLRETLLTLRGWAGMIWQLEAHIEWVRNRPPAGTLEEYLAVRLILEIAALKQVAGRTLGGFRSLAELVHSLPVHHRQRAPIDVDQRAFQVFQLVQIVGWPAESLAHLPKEQWGELVREIEAFHSLERRRIYYAACERRFRRETLDAFSHFEPAHTEPGYRAAFQAVFCIDDREESLRRHLEEVAPACETVSSAGFYGVAMYYRGAADAQFQPLCPVTITPRHFVQEEVLLTYVPVHQRRAGTRRTLGTARHQWHVGSRTFLGGIVTGLCGSLASIPLVVGILFPRLTARVKKRMGRFVAPPPATELSLFRTDPEPGISPEGFGYSVDEMTGITERLLRETGLIRQLSRLVLVLGHGSSSLNNPHESAYNCGACSGGRGGPNARAFAQMANSPLVRQRLKERGCIIPGDTWFLGGFHNTCDDSIIWYDLDRLPATHRNDFSSAREAFETARRANAHERCRRFGSAPLSLTLEESLRQVEQRAEDLSQTRPEYNHATNSLCIVGRRERTRGLFLDRRAFLTSYDPTLDDADSSILSQILQAAVPVCAGISLEYYFSAVDPAGHGCGSKLPHNITSLLGVMEGAASDLRTGLSQQMIEIHDPLRILFLIETTPEAMQQVIDRNATLHRLISNEWVQLATLDPHSSVIHRYHQGVFERYHPQEFSLPEVERSSDWYRGWREPLGFARISGKGKPAVGKANGPPRH